MGCVMRVWIMRVQGLEHVCLKYGALDSEV